MPPSSSRVTVVPRRRAIHHLVAHRVVEQLASADLVADRALEVQALLTLLRREVSARVLDLPQHRERHRAGLAEPELPLVHVRLLRGLPVGGLALGQGEALGILRGLRHAVDRARAATATHDDAADDAEA